jgi:predicted DNA-binding protein
MKIRIREPKVSPMSLRLPQELRDKIEAFADIEQRTLTNMTIVLLKRAVEEYLEPKSQA